MFYFKLILIDLFTNILENLEYLQQPYKNELYLNVPMSYRTQMRYFTRYYCTV